MFKVALHHYLLDLGLSTLFDNFKRNLTIPKPPATPMASICTVSDFVWLYLSDGNEVCGEVTVITDTFLSLEIFDESMVEVVDKKFFWNTIVEMEIVDTTED